MMSTRIMAEDSWTVVRTSLSIIFHCCESTRILHRYIVGRYLQHSTVYHPLQYTHSRLQGFSLDAHSDLQLRPRLVDLAALSDVCAYRRMQTISV